MCNFGTKLVEDNEEVNGNLSRRSCRNIATPKQFIQRFTLYEVEVSHMAVDDDPPEADARIKHISDGHDVSALRGNLGVELALCSKVFAVFLVELLGDNLEDALLLERTVYG
jgi:hypothetical protein